MREKIYFVSSYQKAKPDWEEIERESKAELIRHDYSTDEVEVLKPDVVNAIGFINGDAITVDKMHGFKSTTSESLNRINLILNAYLRDREDRLERSDGTITSVAAIEQGYKGIQNSFVYVDGDGMYKFQDFLHKYDKSVIYLIDVADLYYEYTYELRFA